MSDGITISSIADFNKFIKQVSNELKEKVDLIDAEIGASCEEIATRAKQAAPLDVNGSPISQGIYVRNDGRLSYTIVSSNPYSAYFEFGTGKYAESYVPTLDGEWQELAAKYIRNRKGRIPERSYMYGSFKSVFPQMVKRIKNIINA
jgi:hypothetical protein